jgi:hypothetical protein
MYCLKEKCVSKEKLLKFCVQFDCLQLRIYNKYTIRLCIHLLHLSRSNIPEAHVSKLVAVIVCLSRTLHPGPHRSVSMLYLSVKAAHK